MPSTGAKIHLDRQRNVETFGPDATPQRLLAGDVDMPTTVQKLHDCMNRGERRKTSL